MHIMRCSVFAWFNHECFVLPGLNCYLNFSFPLVKLPKVNNIIWSKRDVINMLLSLLFVVLQCTKITNIICFVVCSNENVLLFMQVLDKLLYKNAKYMHVCLVYWCRSAFSNQFEIRQPGL